MGRALIFDPSARTGGGLSYLLGLGGALKQHGSTHELMFVCNAALRGKLGALESLGLVRFLPDAVSRGGVSVAVARVLALRKSIRDVRPDAVLSMNQLEWRPACRAVLFLRNALYFSDLSRLTRSRLGLRDRLRVSLLRAQTRLSIGNADVLLTPTRAFADLVSKSAHLKALPSVVPFGLNAPAVAPSRPRSPEHGLRILCLHYNLYKDHETVFDAFEKLGALHPDLTLTITDSLEGSGSARRLRQRIMASPLKSRVVLAGHQTPEGMAARFSESDVYIHSSLIESFGHGLLEAMGNAIPCIAADTEVNRELAGSAALFYRPSDSSDLASAVARLAGSAADRAALGLQGVSRASRFSWVEHLRLIERHLFS